LTTGTGFPKDGDLYKRINDESSKTTDWVESPGVKLGESVEASWLLSGIKDPGSDGNFVINVTCKTETIPVGLPAWDAQVELFDIGQSAEDPGVKLDTYQRIKNGALIHKYIIPNVNDTTPTDYAEVIPVESARLIKNYDQLAVRFTFINAGGRPPDPDSDPQKGQLYYIGVDTPPRIYYAFSMATGEGDIAGKYLPTDKPRIFVGTEEKLWLVNDAGAWEDYSKGQGTYGEVLDPTNPSKGWDFTSWGDNVIATNYADLPQILIPGDIEFKDMPTPVGATDPITPKGKYVAVVGEQLMFADINDDSPNITAGLGKAYGLYWSEIGNYEAYSEINLTGQASYQLMTSTPGQITGLVGGEYGVLFKRNSVFRVSYVGLPTIFNFEPLSVMVGCAYPKSIVASGTDVYFWGNGAIYVVRAGSQVQRISTSRVEKMLFDAEYEDYAVKQLDEKDPRESDSIVVGSVDPFSGVVWWSYSLAGDEPYRKSFVLAYNPLYDEFAILKGSEPQLAPEGSPPAYLALNYLLSRQNVISDEKVFTRGILAFRHDDWTGSVLGKTITYEKFSSPFTYKTLMKTKTISSAEFPTVEPGDTVKLTKCRPVYRATPDAKDIDLSVTVQAGEEPTMNNDLEPAQKMNWGERDGDGWMSLKPTLVGEFFDITVEYPETEAGNMRDFLGIQFQFAHGGEN
jgi:hypothetical protein